ncbi:hypothetical protein BLA18112_05034 [Burkholderia lata]|uniref:Uncharacterized protein n=1 Tax=Burkholderia lata (strain ATCC 17760 / DSM 23089 / LMG 22485 / NCIMB 9086 / R18194 / 383) TaxID=482957 RepID=A0A6P2Y482_BURL3|nr:hypothetical protein BLA18112_05034 [Burkholderia lata]
MHGCARCRWSPASDWATLTHEGEGNAWVRALPAAIVERLGDADPRGEGNTWMCEPPAEFVERFDDA